MKIRSLYLKNFRAYKNTKVIFDENMNVVIGQNDIGKSTILEALDIFFGQEVIKIDITDWNKDKEENKIIIGIEFFVDDELEIIIDTSNTTKLKNEYLLNEEKYLEIFKVFDISNDKLSKEKIYLNAYYPECYDIPLINLKIKDLQNKLKEQDLKSDNDKKSAEIRKTLYINDVTDEVNLINKTIDLQKDDGKNIWESLQKELPLYFLFQSDRANKDSDSDIQNPLKTATKRIVADFEDDFKKIKNSLEEKLNQIGIDTIDKMKDMGLDVANSLTPKVTNKNLDTLFSFSLESDDGIALNKRGSGFRRMVMLNYFRAEAERKILEKSNKNVIYAIEEPETAQHPNHQTILINALLELSNKNNHQIIITTHTPEIAKMVDSHNLILINKDENNNPIIIDDNENKLNLIIQTLGILPNINIENIQKVKVVVCFEGYTDIEFIKNINHNIQDFKDIIDINDESIFLVFLGGSTLEHWINNKYLDKLNIPQLHIYDSDSNQILETNRHKYKRFIEKIKRQPNKNYGFETNKAEIENYIHPNIIKEEYQFETFYHLKEADWLNRWSNIENLPNYIKNNKTNQNKALKNQMPDLSKKLTKEHLVELEAFDEIKSWFEKIEELSKL